MTESGTEGVLLRLFEPKPGRASDLSSPPSKSPCPGTQQTYIAVADDDEKPSRLHIHVLSDIGPLLSTSYLYDEDVKANPDWSISWIVCGFINGRDKDTSPTDSPSTIHPLSHSPAAGSKLVINGSTPRYDKESDYHEWYNVEHGPGLAIVPGWNAARRYSLQKTYGEIETANFYGFNYYDEESGLGGPIWQKSTKTEWTYRIRSNAAKPNIRRVWRIQN
ncbi:hypothetical protein OPT61_g6437 [Boeremia exigua]|uniref:Uncharacterized protein n=1 Tax=Boeremia exigua TaxID=749465 RepID=A0ACC2I6N2_9PLEO|nr:hypothetical protein OPT61_g6437 [Boeremia exigua]